MVEKIAVTPVTPSGPINCACVIHGEFYDWFYVERLYNMIERNITPGIKLHVFTEAHRSVPEPMIKHELIDWGISGPKLGWWYKMQLFNPQNYSGPLLYFDLDTVIINNIDWIHQLPLKYFWAVRDFKYLWRPAHWGMNSSIMWWDTRKFAHVWENFSNEKLNNLIKKFPGDQDFIAQAVATNQLRFLNSDRVKSWRWQCLNGGYNFKKRIYNQPETGTILTNDTSVLVFHGKPKQNDLKDPDIIKYWQ